jgi:hypothetical protein
MLVLKSHKITYFGCRHVILDTLLLFLRLMRKKYQAMQINSCTEMHKHQTLLSKIIPTNALLLLNMF